MTSPSAPDAAPPVHPLVYRAVLAATYLPVLLSGMHLHTLGREHVPEDGRLIVAGNHVSGIDPFLIARAMPGRRLQFMTKKELFVPVLGAIIRAGGSFPVDRARNDLGAVRTALRILEAGGTVGIFPEGTRGGGQELQGGVALLALKGRSPVLPVGLQRLGRTWLVRIGPVIEPTGRIKDLTATIGAEMERLSGAV